jgi:hypothetical protein
MAEFTHYIYICVYTHHIWRPQGVSSHGAGPWATELATKLVAKVKKLAAVDVPFGTLI